MKLRKPGDSTQKISNKNFKIDIYSKFTSIYNTSRTHELKRDTFAAAVANILFNLGKGPNFVSIQ